MIKCFLGEEIEPEEVPIDEQFVIRFSSGFESTRQADEIEEGDADERDEKTDEDKDDVGDDDDDRPVTDEGRGIVAAIVESH